MIPRPNLVLMVPCPACGLPVPRSFLRRIPANTNSEVACVSSTVLESSRRFNRSGATRSSSSRTGDTTTTRYSEAEQLHKKSGPIVVAPEPAGPHTVFQRGPYGRFVSARNVTGEVDMIEGWSVLKDSAQPDAIGIPNWSRSLLRGRICALREARRFCASRRLHSRCRVRQDARYLLAPVGASDAARERPLTP